MASPYGPWMSRRSDGLYATRCPLTQTKQSAVTRQSESAYYTRLGALFHVAFLGLLRHVCPTNLRSIHRSFLLPPRVCYDST